MEAHAKFMCTGNNIQERENAADVIVWYERLTSSYVRTVVNRLFQIWYDATHDYTLQFDSSLNDLDAHSKSQGYGKARACAGILIMMMMMMLL